jgi:hypothetical protein
MVEEAFLSATGSSASILKPAVGVVFHEAIFYFLLFQPRGAAFLGGRVIRFDCIRII